MPERKKLISLLETAHGYALLGSIMPFRTACIDLGEKGSDIAKTAADVIDKARKAMGLPEKPAAERYCDAIGLALDRVENGSWP